MEVVITSTSTLKSSMTMASEDDHALVENGILPLSKVKDYPSHIRFRPPPLILTPRLRLRYAIEDDIPVIHTFLAQEETMKFMYSKVSLSLADSERWYKSRFVKDPVTGTGGGDFIYLICLRDGDAEGKPIGTAGSRGAPQLGYQIGAGPQYWGKGYGSEAIGAIIQGICQTIRAEKQEGWEDAYVQVKIEDDNIGSLKVAEKVGMKKFEDGCGIEYGKLIIEYRYYVRDSLA